MSKKGNTRSRRRSLRIWGGYLLVLMAWVVAVMALAFLGFIICASITWQPSPLHDFLNWVRDYIVLVCIVTVLAGWVVISFYFISKPIKQLDVVANAAEQLSRPSEEPIQLPDSLEDISIQLNLEFSVLCLGQIFRNIQTQTTSLGSTGSISPDKSL